MAWYQHTHLQASNDLAKWRPKQDCYGQTLLTLRIQLPHFLFLVPPRAALVPPTQDAKTSVTNVLQSWTSSTPAQRPLVWLEQDRTWHNTMHSGGVVTGETKLQAVKPLSSLKSMVQMYRLGIISVINDWVSPIYINRLFCIFDVVCF